MKVPLLAIWLLAAAIVGTAAAQTVDVAVGANVVIGALRRAGQL